MKQLTANSAASHQYPEFTSDGGGVIFSSNGDLWRVDLSGSNAARVVATPGVDIQPALSPDGGTVAFASNVNGDWDLFLAVLDNAVTPPTAVSYTISGRVTDPGGSTISNVAMRLGGGKSAVTQTDVQGVYSFSGLAAGAMYTLTPEKAGHSFQPSFQTLVLSVNDTANFIGIPLQPIRITTPPHLPEGKVNELYSFTLAAECSQPCKWTITSSALPRGLNLDLGGLLSGTPLAGGTFDFTVQLLDVTGRTDTRSFQLIIRPAAVADLLRIITSSPLAGRDDRCVLLPRVQSLMRDRVQLETGWRSASARSLP
jgi:hypothetical protein